MLGAPSVAEAHQSVQKEGPGLPGEMASRLRLGTGGTGSGHGINRPFRGSDSQGNPDFPARQRSGGRLAG
jgi:hypothetical protein